MPPVTRSWPRAISTLSLLADFIARGFLATHRRRMRRLYARRQQDFFAACPARLDRWLTVGEADTRMQVLGGLNQPRGDAEVHAPALRHAASISRGSRSTTGTRGPGRVVVGLCRDQTGAGAT